MIEQPQAGQRTRSRRCLVRLLQSLAGAVTLATVGTALLLAMAAPAWPAAAAQDLYPSAPDRQFRRVIGVPLVDTLYVQNVATRSVPVEVTFAPLTLDGGTQYVVTDTLPPLSSVVYTTPAGFVGGATVGTDEEDAIYAANLSLADEGAAAGLGTPLAFDSAAAAAPQITAFRLFLPRMIHDENWNTAFTVQNPSYGAAIGVFSFLKADGTEAAPAQIFGLAAGESTAFASEDLAALPPGTLASGVIGSNQVLDIAGDILLANRQQALRASYTLDFGGIEYLVPALFDDFAHQTATLCVQNTGSAHTAVQIDYTDGISQTLTGLNPGASACLDQRFQGHASPWFGGARVQAVGGWAPIAAAVVVTVRDREEHEVGAWAYTPPNNAKVTRNAAFPLVVHGISGWESTIYLYNPSAADASVRAHFVDVSGERPCVSQFIVPAGQVTAIEPGQLPPHFVEGMAYFTSTTPLAATLSATHTLPAAGDSHFGYEAAYPATLPGGIEASCIPAVAAVYTPGDTHYPRQQAYMQEMGVDYLWLRGLAGARPGNPIVVAVIDTGVDLTHPDLAPNLVPGYDFVEDDDTPQDTSRTGHGTRVAGIIAAPINNAPAVRAAASLGVAGIGGGNPLSGTTGLKIMPLRIATDTVAVDCLLSAQAIDYARTHGAQIINMSYGDGEACPEELAAIERAHAAGMALVAGAGNENSSAPFYPAAYGDGANDDLVIAVAGLDPGGRKGPLSNYGPWVDLSAPYRAFSTATGGSYSWETGTSFAAPFVSGLIGVLMSNYGWSHTQAIAALRSTASNVDDQNPGYAGQLGAGRIDAGRASLGGTVVGNELFLPTVRRE